MNDNRLKREVLVELTDKFIKSTNEYTIFEIPDQLYLDYFGEVKNLINQHEFFGDERFVTYGRLDFLRQELTERLKDKNLSKPNSNWGNMWDNRFGAFLDLSDYVRGDRFINPSNVPNGQNFQNILQANDKYYEDGYICFREKNIILDMIRELENNINNRK